MDICIPEVIAEYSQKHGKRPDLIVIGKRGDDCRVEVHRDIVYRYSVFFARALSKVPRRSHDLNRLAEITVPCASTGFFYAAIGWMYYKEIRQAFPWPETRLQLSNWPASLLYQSWTSRSPSQHQKNLDIDSAMDEYSISEMEATKQEDKASGPRQGKPSLIAKIPQRNMMPEDARKLDIARLTPDDKFADLEVSVPGRVVDATSGEVAQKPKHYKLHCSIVGPQSTFFEGKFREIEILNKAGDAFTWTGKLKGCLIEFSPGSIEGTA
ncbi:hypothetical protein TWF730_006125 [Orbilia blumenaviensis]|uniref:BTB domain-containing protein n=1 Tax=Orbilia blumenaviensis TaxID=1796055 RepID=A0AAV9TWI5_9PEZI